VEASGDSKIISLERTRGGALRPRIVTPLGLSDASTFIKAGAYATSVVNAGKPLVRTELWANTPTDSDVSMVAVSRKIVDASRALVKIETTDTGCVSVTIETERLTLTPVTLADIPDYHQHLFGDLELIEKYDDGKVRDLQWVESKVKEWSNRWQSGDPFSAFAIRRNTGEFLGHIVLGHGDLPGHATLAYLIKREQWGRGYAKEAARAVVRDFAPALRAHGFLVAGHQFVSIDATARTDNPASQSILRSAGFECTQKIERDGVVRILFKQRVSEH